MTQRWVTGGNPRYYVRQPNIANCGAAACTTSTSSTGCANAICCK